MGKETLTKEKALINFARAEKSINKTIKMMESGKPCIDIMKQNSDSVAFLRRAHRTLMELNLIGNLKKYN